MANHDAPLVGMSGATYHGPHTAHVVGPHGVADDGPAPADHSPCPCGSGAATFVCRRLACVVNVVDVGADDVTIANQIAARIKSSLASWAGFMRYLSDAPRGDVYRIAAALQMNVGRFSRSRTITSLVERRAAWERVQLGRGLPID